jgi:hypothetical protein
VWLNGSLPGEGGTGRPEKAGWVTDLVSNTFVHVCTICIVQDHA